jgi:predicted nucleotidyltransferase
MRPASQSYLRHPLSSLLGSEAVVRVLRELALHGRELSTPLPARRTGLTDPSVRSVLAQLRDARLLRVYGQGRAASYQLDVAHPLGAMLLELFIREDQRPKSLFDALRDAAERLGVLALWLFGSAARGQDRVGSDLDLLLAVEDEAEVDRVADAFRDVVAEIGEEQRLTISVVPVSGDDVLRLAGTDDPFWRELLADAQPLHGPGPQSLLAALKRARRSRAEVPHG